MRLTRIGFGPEKAADLELDVLLDHRGLILASAALKGRFAERPLSSLAYEIEGESRLEVARFSRIVGLLARTPFAIPAPLNVLDGPIGLRSKVKFDNSGGEVTYRLASGSDRWPARIHSSQS